MIEIYVSGEYSVRSRRDGLPRHRLSCSPGENKFLASNYCCQTPPVFFFQCAHSAIGVMFIKYVIEQNHSGATDAPCDQEDVGPPCKGSRCSSI